MLAGERPMGYRSKEFWDQRYGQRAYIYGKEPANFIAKNYDVLKPNSRILDVGMGEGRNAVFLAKKGHNVVGIDISSIAVKKARFLAKEAGVRLEAIVGSIDKYQFRPASFDAIVCFYYVDPRLFPKFFSWLKPDGMLIFEAHTYKHPGFKNGKITKDEAVAPKSLIKWFADYSIKKFEEKSKNGEYRASIIVQKDQAIH